MESIDNISLQASRCLKCKNPMCRKGCPIATNIPEFINEIKQSKFLAAYNILQSNNLMSEICSTVCPVEKQCMGSCVRGIKGEPVQINYLEKFINTWANTNNINYEIPLSNTSNKKVAIIGAGPAGLACAIELRKSGAEVTIFEKDAKCGGILEYGIPDFRLSKDIIEKLLEKLKKIGIKFVTNTELGKDIGIEELKNEGYDDIVLAMGAQVQSTYNLTNNNTQGIYKSDDFLKHYNIGQPIKDLGVTVIIGGGNVALDSARVAAKMGAKEVYILYRRNAELMPARKIELEEAINDGVKIMYQTKVINAKDTDGKLSSIECIKTRIENEKAIDIENSNFTMQVNTVVFAIGSRPDENLLNGLNIKTENGLVCVDENYMTSIEGIYAGGDLVESKSSVCRAISTGKKIANAILVK